MFSDQFRIYNMHAYKHNYVYCAVHYFTFNINYEIKFQLQYNEREGVHGCTY